MKYPNFNEEKKLWKQGYKIIAGIDEAGRGPLAGPVVAAAVAVLDYKKMIRQLADKNINDSKKLSEKQREEIYEKLISWPEIRWGVGIVSETVIDKINILQATKLAMNRALKKTSPDFLLIDGNFKINSIVPQSSIVSGDQKVMSIAMASIIAKVTRDRLMQRYHKKYPQYGFDKHKGYGTATHFASLEEHGPCKIHRKTFYPVNKFI